MAQKIKPVTDQEWNECNEWNRMIVDEFLQQQHLSDQTLKQYSSSLRIFVRYVKDSLMNKPIHELRARDALKFQNMLLSIGLSSNAVKFKRSSVSSLCNYIELYYGEDFPTFRNIFSKAIPNPAKEMVREKKPIPKNEFDNMIQTLKDEGELQMVAYLLTSYYTGARRAEVAQFKKSFLEMDKVKGKDYYSTPLIRGKGKGKAGKKIKLHYDDVVRDAILDWLEQRGEDELDEVFVRKYKDGRVEPLSPSAFNDWFVNKFNKMLTDPATPHALRRSRATHMVVDEGMSIDKAKALLNHESSETTSIYVIKETDDELDDIF